MHFRRGGGGGGVVSHVEYYDLFAIVYLTAVCSTSCGCVYCVYYMVLSFCCCSICVFVACTV